VGSLPNGSLVTHANLTWSILYDIFSGCFFSCEIMHSVCRDRVEVGTADISVEKLVYEP
jgi:hypothetical protein